jgi:hypothetical protein
LEVQAAATAFGLNPTPALGCSLDASPLLFLAFLLY